jgi:glycosyltransferase involved in cell wall biosynthesis
MNLLSIDNFLKHNNYYSGNVLINNPDPIEGTIEPTLSYFYDGGGEVNYSLIIPVHNQEEIIIKNLSSVLKNTVYDFELIMIFDSCTDNSENIVIEYLKNNYFNNLTKIKIITSPTPLFETTCDNIGFRLAEGKYLVEIQADIEIFTYGFNHILSEPIRRYNDVISISGRCTHNLYDWNEYVGKMGGLVEQPLQLDFNSYNKFYVGDTCNRGPWVLDKSKLIELGYLDEYNFVLGDDDHDLNIRASFKKWVCGYIPIEFKSLLSEGSTRKPMDEVNKQYLEIRRNRGDGGIIRKINNKEIEFISKKIKTRNI